MGGGGFSMEPDKPLLDDFILSLSRRHPARVCFIPTASADSTSYIVSFYRAFSGRCIPTDLTLFDSPLLNRRPARSSELASFVANKMSSTLVVEAPQSTGLVARAQAGRRASGCVGKRDRVEWRQRKYDLGSLRPHGLVPVDWND